MMSESAGASHQFQPPQQLVPAKSAAKQRPFWPTSSLLTQRTTGKRRRRRQRWQWAIIKPTFHASQLKLHYVMIIFTHTNFIQHCEIKMFQGYNYLLIRMKLLTFSFNLFSHAFNPKKRMLSALLVFSFFFFLIFPYLFWLTSQKGRLDGH